MKDEARSDRSPDRPRYSRGLRLTLWILALLIMATSVVYQRLTGPTHPLRGRFTVAGQSHRFRLIRSQENDADARVAVPAPDADVKGRLFHKRFKTDDAFTSTPLTREKNELFALLPSQPAAGKLEYYLVLEASGTEVRIPEQPADNVIIRFKNPVPLSVLIPHVAIMFLGILVGVRTALAALFTPRRFRGLAWFTWLALTAGGMVLGPVVQNHAFGAYWTGFPFGYDLTDNKTLIMWVVWLLACAIVGLRSRPRMWPGRLAVLFAAMVMLAVYLVPHSMRGSELDYGKLERGVSPTEAIGTGDR